MNKCIISHPTNGLGNRLRNIASAAILGEEIKRDFYLKWELFPAFWSRNFPLPRASLLNSSSSSTYKNESLNRPLTVQKIEEDPAEVIFLLGGQSFIPSGVSVSAYNSRKSEFYNSLLPLPAIANPAREYVANFFSGNSVLGIQLRAGDLGPGKLGVCLSPEDSLPFIDPHINAFDTIFITSNDPSFIEVIRTTYPRKNFLFYSGEEARDTSGSQGGSFWANKGKLNLMREDLIEWYILAEVDLLIHSHASSFAHESLFINKRTRSIEMVNPKKKNTPWDNNTRELIYET